MKSNTTAWLNKKQKHNTQTTKQHTQIAHGRTHKINTKQYVTHTNKQLTKKNMRQDKLHHITMYLYGVPPYPSSVNQYL